MFSLEQRWSTRYGPSAAYGHAVEAATAKRLLSQYNKQVNDTGRNISTGMSCITRETKIPRKHLILININFYTVVTDRDVSNNFFN